MTQSQKPLTRVVRSNMREKTITIDSDDIDLLEDLLDRRQTFVEDSLRRNWKPDEKETISKFLARIKNLRQRVCE
jgi:hypothetical protein